MTLARRVCASVVWLTRLLIYFRYKKPADWELLSGLAEKHTVPLIGNGDILTYYEVHPSHCCSNHVSHGQGSG